MKGRWFCWERQPPERRRRPGCVGTLVTACLFSVVLLALAGATRGGDTEANAGAFQRQVRPLLARYCLECHGAEEPEADLNLARFASEAEALADRPVWKRLADMLHAREMPPPESRQPTPQERDQLTDWAEELLGRPDESGVRNPGHVAARRLNRTEYNLTIYDLFGINRKPTYFNPARGMPDKIRILLHINQRSVIVDLPPDDVGYGYDNIGEVLSLPPFLMEKYFTAAQHVVQLAAGEIQDARQSRNQPPGPSRALQLRGRPENRQTAQEIIGDLARRAFRRPVPDDELAQYMALFDLALAKGESFQKALQVPLQALLVSPHFLFRIESGIADEDRAGVRPLTDYELATRLSYFLWSSLPDDELFALADQGRLRDPQVLEQEVRRMLRSSKAKALSENFAIQWLQLATLEGAMPDPELFREYYKLKYIPSGMKHEAQLLFETVMVEDRSMLDLVDPDFAWLNGTLADFYGVKPGKSNQTSHWFDWYRFPLTDRRRGGVLTLGGVLVMTSNSTRTSPVNRGKWILETLLGAPAPPPPANVPELDNSPPAEAGLSLREKLERHRADPNCASCHRRMDPLGFALENYNPIGAWRDRDGPLPIDATGVLSDGTPLDGPVAIKDLLRGPRRDDFIRCLTEHLLTYALGRKLEYYDAATVSEIAAAVAQDEYRFSRLVVEVARSYPFTHLKMPESSQ